MHQKISQLAVRIAELEAEVRCLRERQQIHEMYLRYTRGLDRCDLELLRSAFWPDAQVNYGANSWLSNDWINIWHGNYLKRLTSQAHHLTNETMDISGDVAHVESYLIALRRTNDGKSAIIGGGRYIDRVDRRNGEWRIAVREFTPHCWLEAPSVINTYWPKYAIELGTEDKSDPSYRRPLAPRSNSTVEVATQQA